MMGLQRVRPRSSRRIWFAQTLYIDILEEKPDALFLLEPGWKHGSQNLVRDRKYFPKPLQYCELPVLERNFWSEKEPCGQGLLFHLPHLFPHLRLRDVLLDVYFHHNNTDPRKPNKPRQIPDGLMTHECSRPISTRVITSPEPRADIFDERGIIVLDSRLRRDETHISEPVQLNG